MTIPYTFAGATTAIPLAQLDANFASPITLGNVAMTLSNTYTSIGNLTLTNVTVSSGSVAVTDLTYTGTLTGGTGVVNLGSGQFYKDASGNVGIGVNPSTWSTDYKALQISNYASFYGRVSSNETGIMNNMYRNGSAQYTYLNSAAAAWYYISGSSHNWTSSASGTAGNAVTTTQVLSVDRGLTLALQGASSNSGTGISFPATQSASSDANTLDDYEEGTWTPSLSRASVSPVISTTVSGGYTKVGNVVTIWGIITINSVTSQGSNLWLVSGIPFNFTGTRGSMGAAGNFSATTISTAQNITACGDSIAATNYFYLQNADGSAFNSNVQAGTLYVTLTYQV